VKGRNRHAAYSHMGDLFGAAFLGACVHVCCEEEGDLSGSESCSKPVGGKIAIVVSGPTWL